MKGIIVAGGSGTRLHPMTLVVSKHILPVYDKPLIFYPLTLLMLGSIRDILIISTPRDIVHFRALLGDGGQWGVRIAYAEQPRPEGIAQTVLIAEDFLGGQRFAMVLGDNIFYGHGLPEILRRGFAEHDGATVFVTRVANPSRYGVLEINDAGEPISIEEKPAEPKSDWAVTGLYAYDAEAVAIAKTLKPSARGELEITALNAAYLERSKLKAERLGRGFAWFDAGVPDSLLDAANLMATVEKRQAIKIAVPEEIAFLQGFIDDQQLRQLIAERYPNNDYGRYLTGVLEHPL
jgi:glucose-1-phosphate thymidylyltransferase